MKRFLALAATGALILSVTTSKQEEEPTFTPKTWNAVERVNEDGSITTNFDPTFINYLTGTGEWEPVDFSPTETMVAYVYDKLPYKVELPKIANEPITFTNNNRFDIIENKEKNDPPLSKTRAFVGAEPIEGELVERGVFYRDAFPDIGASLFVQLHEQEVRYLVQWDEDPQCTGEITVPFVQEISNKQASLKSKGADLTDKKTRTRDGMTAEISPFRKIETPPAYIWDSQIASMPIDLSFQVKGGKILGEKHIPCGFFKDAVFPVFSDDVDGFTSNTADDSTYKANASYATVRGSAAGDALRGGTVMYVYARKDAGDFVTERGFAYWVTGSTIPAGNTVASATLTVFFPSTNGEARTTYLVENRAGDAVATGDYSAVGDSGIGTGTGQPFGSVARTASEGAGSEVFTINSTGLGEIAKGSGNTYFAFVAAKDWDNVTPVFGSDTFVGGDINSADAASNRPTLSVTHNSPVAPVNGRKAIMIMMEKLLFPPAFAHENP